MKALIYLYCILKWLFVLVCNIHFFSYKKIIFFLWTFSLIFSLIKVIHIFITFICYTFSVYTLINVLHLKFLLISFYILCKIYTYYLYNYAFLLIYTQSFFFYLNKFLYAEIISRPSFTTKMKKIISCIFIIELHFFYIYK